MLHTLLRGCDPSIDLSCLPDLPVVGIKDDSRLVNPGDLFVARTGTKTDGRRFVDDAIAKGAVAIVSDAPIDNAAVPVVIVKDAADASSKLAHAILGHPTKSMKVIGITGTNGKTTTTYLLRHILKKFGTRCGLVGTVEIDDGHSTRESDMTTPGAVQLAELFADMKANGCGAVAIETSSHALHQRRTSGVRFAGGGFTNLTGDHLDYHGDMESYAAAKSLLFAPMPTDAVVAVNRDDKWAERVTRYTNAKRVWFSQKSDADYRASKIKVSAQGSQFVLTTPDGEADVHMQLIGQHNIENALCAATIAGEVFGLSVHQIASALRDAQGAPGRLQAVKAGQPYAVLVDYAHTDDALKNVLQALKPLTQGSLRVLFGCGGDRDRSKRPRMAAIACELADAVYLTSDNPRTERPEAILHEILSGVPAATEARVQTLVDRRAAIQRIIGDSRPGDVVLIAGKGHENYQIVGTTKHHFDDVEESTNAIRAMQVKLAG